jgi:hypothetical protein
MRRIAAFLLLAGLSQIPLWAGDYFMPGRSLYPTYHEDPPAAPVVVSEVRVEPLAPAPVLTPAKVTKPAAKKTAPVAVTVAQPTVVVPASGSVPVVAPVYGKTVGVELLPPTGMGRAVSATPPAATRFAAPAGTVSIQAAHEMQSGSPVKATKKAAVKAPTETLVPVAVTLPGTTVTHTEYVAATGTSVSVGAFTAAFFVAFTGDPDCISWAA